LDIIPTACSQVNLGDIFTGAGLRLIVLEGVFHLHWQDDGDTPGGESHLVSQLEEGDPGGGTPALRSDPSSADRVSAEALPSKQGLASANCGQIPG